MPCHPLSGGQISNWVPRLAKCPWRSETCECKSIGTGALDCMKAYSDLKSKPAEIHFHGKIKAHIENYINFKQHFMQGRKSRKAWQMQKTLKLLWTEMLSF